MRKLHNFTDGHRIKPAEIENIIMFSRWEGIIP